MVDFRSIIQESAEALRLKFESISEMSDANKYVFMQK